MSITNLYSITILKQYAIVHKSMQTVCKLVEQIFTNFCRTCVNLCNNANKNYKLAFIPTKQF